MDSFFNRSPLNTTAKRKMVLFSDITAVNLMVGWTDLLACLIKWSSSVLSLFPYFWLCITLLY